MQKLQNHIANRAGTGIAIASLLCAVSGTSVHANGIYGNGTGAASMAMGGTGVAWSQSPLEAMGENPAGLGFLSTSEFDLGGIGASANGTFNKPSANSSGNLNESPAALPEGAFGMHLGNSPFSAAISFIPQSMLYADWHYPDPPSSGGTTYGYQEDKSEILVLRSAAGLALQLSPQLSAGLSVGAVYNQNELVTPYDFQNLSPASAGVADGAKTLLNLHTAGWGWNVQVGALYRPITNLQFGLSFQTKYTVRSTGDAYGNPYAQFGVSLPFHYNAEVDNTFPEQVALGGSWKFLPKWRLAAEVDWVGWANSFKTLPVILTDGNNATINTVLGTSSFSDAIPLNWRDEFVYRAGLEYAITHSLSLRAGYCYGNNPVPSTTLNPMTAAIMENTITAGIGYRWRACEFDLAYQCDLPVNEHVGISGLQAGEYSNSSTEVQINWVALTMRLKF
jgi:long-chain fatty acid transport protein